MQVPILASISPNFGAGENLCVTLRRPNRRQRDDQPLPGLIPDGAQSACKRIWIDVDTVKCFIYSFCACQLRTAGHAFSTEG